VTAYSKISQDTINGRNVMQAEKSLKMTKIMWHKGHAAVSRQISHGILILVKGYKLSIRA
jgi:hypothetical protein